MWGYLFRAAGIAVLLADLYFLWISLGFRKKYVRSCKGYLEKTVQHKNVYVGGKGGRVYRRYLDYRYVYRVDGKQFCISGSIPGTKESLRPSVDIVYQKRRPRRAYIRKLTIPHQPIIALILCPLWIGLLALGFLFL